MFGNRFTNRLDLRIAEEADATHEVRTIMIKRFGILILAAILFAGCSFPFFESYPQQQTTMTTTTSCPDGTQLRNDGMCG